MQLPERYLTALASEGEESMIALVKANEGDLEFLSQVCLDIAELYSPILPDAFERQSEKFQNNGLPKNYNIRIIVCNGERVGFLGDMYLKSGTYYLTALYFLMKFQRCGLGRELHEIIVNELLEAGVDRLALFAHEEAYWAIDFYKNIGYEVIGETRRDVEEYDRELIIEFLPCNKV